MRAGGCYAPPQRGRKANGGRPSWMEWRVRSRARALNAAAWRMKCGTGTGDCATEAAGDGRRACIDSGAAWRVCGAVGACLAQWVRALASLLGTVGARGAVCGRPVHWRLTAWRGCVLWRGEAARRHDGATRLGLGAAGESAGSGRAATVGTRMVDDGRHGNGRRRSAREWSTTVGTGMVDVGRHGNGRRDWSGIPPCRVQRVNAHAVWARRRRRRRGSAAEDRRGGCPAGSAAVVKPTARGGRAAVTKLTAAREGARPWQAHRRRRRRGSAAEDRRGCRRGGSRTPPRQAQRVNARGVARRRRRRRGSAAEDRRGCRRGGSGTPPRHAQQVNTLL